VVMTAKLVKQGVVLTARNTTGPPCAAPGELLCDVDCYRRRQMHGEQNSTGPLHYV